MFSDTRNLSNFSRRLSSLLGPSQKRLSDEKQRRGSETLKEDRDLITLNTSDESKSLWDRNVGSMLSEMLRMAGYPKESHDLHRAFFTDRVADALGPYLHGNEDKTWESFMTDDFTPVELSWCWCSQRNTPVVRYSVEPIGRLAGSVSDPFNLLASVRLLGNTLPIAPELDLQLYRHFFQTLVSPTHIKPDESQFRSQNPLSQTFIAFDLLPDKVVTKYYFLPTWRSLRTGKSNLGTIEKAIQSLPGSGNCFSQSFKAVRDYIDSFDEKSQPQVQILAIDCVDPMQSRIKIYIRSSATSLDSVLETLTLGTKLEPISDSGHASFQELWCNVFGIDHASFRSSDPLPEKAHQTSGMLYYLEIKANSPLPKTKVYLPVRHYAQSDEQIARGLSDYLEKRGKRLTDRSYYEGLSSLCKHRKLADGLGFHTYVSCASEGDSWTVTSYLNPEIYHATRS